MSASLGSGLSSKLLKLQTLRIQEHQIFQTNLSTWRSPLRRVMPSQQGKDGIDGAVQQGEKTGIDSAVQQGVVVDEEASISTWV